MNKSPDSKDNPWRAVALVSAIGADLVVCMAAGYWAGNYVSNLVGGQPVWIVAGIMSGFVIGVVSIIFLLKRYAGGSNG
jgi:ATP synthase protein I